MNSPENHQQHGGNYLRVDLGSSTIAIVVSLMVIIGACGVVIGLDISERRSMLAQLAEVKTVEVQRERETRMLEYYVMELDGKLMAMGIIKHPDSWSARKEKAK